MNHKKIRTVNNLWQKASNNGRPSQNYHLKRQDVVNKPVKQTLWCWTRSLIQSTTSWNRCPESRNIHVRRSKTDLASMIKTSSTFYPMVTSLILKGSTLIDKVMTSLVDIMIPWLVTIFLVPSMPIVHSKRIRVTMQEIPGVTIRRNSLDLTTTVWCKTRPNSERITVVSTLIRVKDSTARVSSTLTSSQIVVNQIILTNRTSPEEIRSTRTAAIQVVMSFTHQPKIGSRETQRSIQSIWCKRILRTSLETYPSQKVRRLKYPRPTSQLKAKLFRKKTIWRWQSYEECGWKIIRDLIIFK